MCGGGMSMAEELPRKANKEVAP
ncbi:uncharacterized protein G2W53_008858 [Senna tora]|uniref:Uncharacterized protein n=1 Tax=Senna tora TaxID=362788 RepID=A0A835C742_9FABA|nr:uncharacterized protein G2W53_008858 [Senna tora]